MVIQVEGVIYLPSESRPLNPLNRFHYVHRTKGPNKIVKTRRKKRSEFRT